MNPIRFGATFRSVTVLLLIGVCAFAVFWATGGDLWRRAGDSATAPATAMRSSHHAPSSATLEGPALQDPNLFYKKLEADERLSPEDRAELMEWYQRCEMMSGMFTGFDYFFTTGKERWANDNPALLQAANDVKKAIDVLRPNLKVLRAAIDQRDVARVREVREAMQGDFDILRANMLLMDGLMPHDSVAPHNQLQLR